MIIQPRKAINKAWLKVKPVRSEIETFKTNLIRLIGSIDNAKDEEFHKTEVRDFLKNTWYKEKYYFNVKKNIDWAIFNGPKASDSVGVLIETKKPANKAEMVSRDNLNKKALHELILYYLRERINGNNLEIKHIVATNIYEWFIFDAGVFEKLFAENKTLIKLFKQFEEGSLSGSGTDFFYKTIAEPEVARILNSGDAVKLEYTWFDIRDYEKPLKNNNKQDDNKLIVLFKLLSPEHLLKLPFANDSNSLDKSFYAELLHIIGLAETKEGNKKVIGRKPAARRDPGSLLENAIVQLENLDKVSRLPNPSHYGANHEERLFNVALELSITWVNRILFLKLLEAQLISYHNGDKDFSFLNPDKIKDYDDLNALFFSVLARKPEERLNQVRELFAHVPYLNSSLFEISEIEDKTIVVSNLKDEVMLPLHPSTVLKEANGKRRTGALNALQYFFEFLDAYDFSGEGAEEIQEDNKTLINASVLGLIFEKINGYKDGSFFTPGFITMYMCRETIRHAIAEKFNEVLSPPSLAANHYTPLPQGDTPLPQGEGSARSAGGEELPPLGVTDPVPTDLLRHTRELRKKQTPAEELLWQLLRNRKLNNWKFRRQHPVREGFIIDFFCPETRVAIEVDGGYHNRPDQWEYDETRTKELEKYGIRVIRFANEEVLEKTEDVLQKIVQFSSSPPAPLHTNHHTSLPQEEGSARSAGCEANTLAHIYDAIGRDITKQQANDLINSLRICDPAVGSGHFLVSALNEIIAIKSELKILCDREGKTLRDYHVEVVNDELVITDEDGAPFKYNPRNRESQRVQEALFHEKQAIIENCLFGVDVNPNSVKICRLRLWIELLKHAYYIQDVSPSNSSPVCYAGSGELRDGFKPAPRLQTLPNIDINIKCGNSLISRFDLDADVSQALKKSKWTIDSYRSAVQTYREAANKEEKRQMERLIDDIKSDFETEISKKDKRLIRLNKARGELFNLTNQQSLFGMSDREKKAWEKKVEKLTSGIGKLEAEIEEIKSNKIFENAFEWRFEFPEVLDGEGDFKGFDVVIGNPPYIRQEEFSGSKPYLQSQYETYAGTADLYVYFVEKGLKIAREKGQFVYILPNKWMRAGYGLNLRKWIRQYSIESIIDFGDLPVFEEATTYPCIWFIRKNSPASPLFKSAQVATLKFDDGLENYLSDKLIDVDQTLLPDTGWTLVDDRVQRLLEKIKKAGTPLGEYVQGKIFRGVLTGLNEAFVIDRATRDRLIQEDPGSAEIIKPFLAGRDIKRYQQPKSDKYLILFKNGATKEWLGDLKEDEAWKKLSEMYPAVTSHLEQFKDKAKARYDKGQYWWELRACDYYEEFEKPKILWPGITDQVTSFAYDSEQFYGNDNNQLIVTDNHSILAILNSKISKFYLTNICDFVRGGFVRLKIIYVASIPIPKEDYALSLIGNKVMQILSLKKQNPDADTSVPEAEIDLMVYKLYGLTWDEVKIVDREFNLSKEEYEQYKIV